MQLAYMDLLHVKIRKANQMSKIGITGWGWYIPRYQLDRSAMSSAFRMNSGRGSRSVAAYDEDSMTMAIESARRTLRAESNINNLIFSTTHSPVLDKGNASSMAAVLGLPFQVGAYDLGGSIRSGFGSLKFGLSQDGESLVMLSDLRYGRPGSDDEVNGGDGAASFTFGENPVVEVVDVLSESSPVMDRWRAEGELGTQVWDDRWSADQQTALMLKVTKSILEKNSLTEADLGSIVISSASVRSVATISSQVKASSLQSSEIDQFGFLGAADLGVRLAWTLENAKAGQYILVVLGADGADAMLLKTTQRLSSAQFGRELVGTVEQVDVPTYLTWRGLVSREAPRRPDPEAPSAPAAARNHDWKFAFIGSECTACGSRQLPPQRVCMSCGAIDKNRTCSMSAVKSTVKTFTVDRIAFSLSPPVVVGVIDFDGGGRFRCQLTEVTPDDVAVNDRMEMVYRLISISSNGVRNYFWKARPVRENS
jgi:3-hydroxy-3-methylglutaryl CoA synthase/uncharacterized OB-fold protein